MTTRLDKAVSAAKKRDKKEFQEKIKPLVEKLIRQYKPDAEESLIDKAALLHQRFSLSLQFYYDTDAKVSNKARVDQIHAQDKVRVNLKGKLSNLVRDLEFNSSDKVIQQKFRNELESSLKEAGYDLQDLRNIFIAIESFANTPTFKEKLSRSPGRQRSPLRRYVLGMNEYLINIGGKVATVNYIRAKIITELMNDKTKQSVKVSAIEKMIRNIESGNST